MTFNMLSPRLVNDGNEATEYGFVHCRFFWKKNFTCCKLLREGVEVIGMA